MMPLDPRSTSSPEPEQEAVCAIAIIGMAGRFPGAANVDAFWQNLLACKDAISRFKREGAQEGFVGARGVLEDAAMFDADYFSINPREAQWMDPQHRVFLEVCAETLDDAGYDPLTYPGEIGLFAGCSLNTYLLANLAKDRAFLDELTANYQVGEFQTALGNDKDFLTTRVAYKLNLRGPCVSVQSACATSLVAICQAAQSLLTYQCDMALAGGVSITFPQQRGHIESEGGMASTDGTLRPFDAKASGTVFGHGAGAVLLKRLDEAVRDGDHISAVLRGFAVNNDGSGKVSYMAPGAAGQARVISAAQAMAGFAPETVTYIEAHGTGTPLGDPIEIAALTEAFGTDVANTGFCSVGSAKANIGHLDSAAGVAGTIKAALAISHRTLPGLTHFTAPNPHLSLDRSPFRFDAETKPWTSANGLLRAGVSAFGVGGVNAHVVLEQAPVVHREDSARSRQTLCLSARSGAALEAARARLNAWFAEHPQACLADVAFTLATGRRAFAHRFALAAGSVDEAREKLQQPTRPASSTSESVAFLFPGQGSQLAGMGASLYASEPIFRGMIDELCGLAQSPLNAVLRELILVASEANDARLQETRFAQPALFIVSLAMATLLESWGIRAQALCGHSVGEYVAATLGQVFSPADALRLVCQRGARMQQMAPGAMLSVPLDEAALTPLLVPGISIAALNSPRSSVVAGSLDAIAAFEQALEKRGIATRRLRTSHAFHSEMMEPLIEGFEAEVAECRLHAPVRPFVSTVTGEWITDAEATSPAYWSKQIRHTVRFGDAVATLQQDQAMTLIEVGPGSALTSLARQQGASAIATMPHTTRGEAESGIQQALAELWSAGVAIDWQAYFAGERRQRISLPAYPFERKLFWVEPPAKAEQPPADRTTSRLEANVNPTPSPALTPVTSPAAADDRQGRIERRIVEVLAELSGVQIGSDELQHSFFELGLDSLLLTQAVLSLSRAFSHKVTFRELMEKFSTVRDLAQHLDNVLPPDAFAAPPITTPAQAAPSNTAVGALLEQQMKSLSEMFAAQMAALQAVAGGASMTAPPKPSVTVTDQAEVKHGSFRPVQARASYEMTPQQQRYIDELIARYEQKTPGSKRITGASRKHLADPRAVAGFRPQWKEMVYPLVTDRAKGSRIWDVDGNEYIDIVNGYGCILFGHSPDFVIEAAQQQLARGVAIGPQSALSGEVAEMICEMTGNERVTFCNTGSEAVMAAIRVARTVTGRDKLVYFSGDYHGTFDEVLIRSTPRGSAPVAPGIPLANTGNVVVLEYGAAASLDYIRSHADEIAAVLIEPVQTRHPELQPFDFIRSIREITETHDIAMILDEVVTGFRLAPGGVQQMMGLRADMCTYGKVLGGGHPIGVLSGKARFLDALDGGAWQYGDDSAPEVGVTFFAGTFVRHPLALAVARAVLTHLKHAGPTLQQELNRTAATLASSLDSFFQQRGVPSRVHSFASWFYFTFPGDARLAGLLYYAMRARGIHIQEGYPCFLTTAHTDADLRAIEGAFHETILEMQAAGVMPGPAVEAPEVSIEATPALHSIRPTPSRIPMTEPQREIFLAAMMSDEANCAFNESLTLELRGPVRQEAVRLAIDSVMARHDALRSFICNDGEALCFSPAFIGELECVDLSAMNEAQQQVLLAERIAQEGRTPFNLHAGPMVRCACFIASPDAMTILLTAHHLVLDGWSANLVLDEIARIYSKGASAKLPRLLPFSEYAVQQNRRQADGEFQQNEAYWLARFHNRNPKLELPTDHPRPPKKTFAGATLCGSLDASLCGALKRVSAANGCSLYVTMLAGFQLLLHRLSGQDEVVSGISTAGQALAGDVSLVGHCVNFLPMLSELHGGETVREHLLRTRTALLDAQEHQEFTYGSLLQKLKLERDASRLPLIEVQFNLEKVGNNVRFDGLQTTIRTNPKQFVNTDLFLNVIEDDGRLEFTCDFNRDLFDRETIVRWMQNWEQMLSGMAADVSAPVTALPILPPAERELVISAWNQTRVDFPAFESVPATILRIAAMEPTRIAAQCGGRVWTYGELAEYATLLARRLVHEGLKPGGLTGICIERSLEMAGAMLAVLLAGGTYVPLDPRHPRERLARIIQNAGIELLLTGRDPSVDSAVTMLNITGPQPSFSDPLPNAAAERDLAYVIYTSGTTGVPKGVAVEHGSLVNLLRAMQREPGFDREDTLVAVTTLAFDIAALELLLPLISGGRLIIATDDQVQDGASLLHLLSFHKATVLQATPGAWRIVMDAGWNSSMPLRALCGGEALPRDLADALLARTTDVWNMYGPTETTIWSSATRVTAGKDAPRIGPPTANTQFYLLDQQLQPVPIGVSGELFIGGAGLARGYWHDVPLTAQRFIPNPFGAGRLYRTGDLARWHRDGSIQLLGRADFQVKLRGYRIELGEIEAVLARDPRVREAAVLVHTADASSRLLAFVETTSEDVTLPADLLAEAAKSLPEYMVPQQILIVPAMPRNTNGKLDRRALASFASAQTLSPAAREFVEPVTPDQLQLAAIWAEMLKLDRVSITDSIFELGGDSLLIFRIAARAQREGLAIKGSHIFEHRTIAAICDYLRSTTYVAPPIAPLRITAAPRDRYRLGRANADV